MNKKFYFALALTAGLFASCSSDDLTADAPRNGIEINDSEPALIKLNIGNPNGTTRGTGSVGWGVNKWVGQSFNIFMFEKGTLDLGYEATNPETGEPDYIFDNATLVTSEVPTEDPEGSQSNADFYQVNAETGDPEIKFNYFPSNGKTYSFWAYRIDDADDPDVDEAYKYTDDNGVVAEGEGRTQVRVPFKIDGSQDIMIADIDEDQAATDLVAADRDLGKTLATEDAEAKIFSAYSARRDVNPKLVFSHQLTRLYFEVKAAHKDVSDAAVNPTDMEHNDEQDLDWYPGYKVTSISVMSKDKGEVIAAYKNKSDIPENAERVVWTDATQQWSNPASLAELQLRSRAEQDDAPDFKWVRVNKAAVDDYTITDAGEGYDGYLYNGSAIIPFSDDEARADFMVYTSNEVYETGDDAGEPKTEPMKLSEVPAGITFVYFAVVPAGTHPNGEPWTERVKTSNAKDNLLDELTPVTPHWVVSDGTPGGWSEIERAPETYTWTHLENPTDDQKTAGNAHIEPASVAIDNHYAPEGVVLVVKDGDDPGTIICHMEDGVREYYELTAMTYNTEGATVCANSEAYPENPANGAIVYDEAEAKYYQYTAPTAGAGRGEPTSVGEAVLVAPEDEGYGYTVNFTFARCKKLTAHSWFEQEGHSTITVKLKQPSGFDPATAEPGTAKAFQPGKAYKVTAVIYSDGEIKTENVTIIGWDEDGTEDEMENGGVQDMN